MNGRPNMTRTVFTGLILALLCTTGPPFANALSPDVETLERDLETLMQERSDLADRVEERTVALDELAERINILKRRIRENPRFLDRHRLQNMLADSLEMSRELDLLEQRVVALDERIREARRRIAAEADTEIARVTQLMRAETRKREQRRLVSEYFQYRAIKNRYRLDEAPGEFVVVEFRADELDSPEEIDDKASFVRGFRSTIASYVENIDTRMQELERELRLSQEMNRLIAEENIFIDDGFPSIEGPRSFPYADLPGDEELTTPGDDEIRIPDTNAGGDTTLAHPLLSTDLVGGFSRDRSLNNSIQNRLEALARERAFLSSAIRELETQERSLLERARRLREEEGR